ncbi:MAG: hypothetical protein H0W04_09345 [Chthoniobacterales bacterium]|nr:hypothetical protein [Chthoniobacterales bacterium]
MDITTFVWQGYRERCCAFIFAVSWSPLGGLAAEVFHKWRCTTRHAMAWNTY